MRDLEYKTIKRARALRKQMPKAEVILWVRLRELTKIGMRFRRQHPIGPFIADFACPLLRLVVEIDGGTHSTDAEVAYDRRREAFINSRGWRVIRFQNWEVYEHMEMVMDGICRYAPDGVTGPLRRFAPPPP